MSASGAPCLQERNEIRWVYGVVLAQPVSCELARIDPLAKRGTGDLQQGHYLGGAEICGPLPKLIDDCAVSWYCMSVHASPYRPRASDLEYHPVGISEFSILAAPYSKDWVAETNANVEFTCSRVFSDLSSPAARYLRVVSKSECLNQSWIFRAEIPAS